MVMNGLKIDKVERGRIICSYSVPSRLVVQRRKYSSRRRDLTTGAESIGVSVDISVTYLGEAFVNKQEGLVWSSSVPHLPYGHLELPQSSLLQRYVQTSSAHGTGLMSITYPAVA
ncbi:hypothetical protein M569_07312 [Genlisea aurea]|uniref:Uncharacterized protein n=1 Tax=Genlisea aurea TaxID=192259 RepID=S8DWB3_9LAMI|nr:hypothetical protein M569_07312 [Genlisea aurea]